MHKSSLIKSVAVVALCCSLHANCIAGPEQVSEAFGEISRLIATSQRRGLPPDAVEPKVLRVVSRMENLDDIYTLGLTARIMFEGHDSMDKETCRLWENVFWQCAKRQGETRSGAEKEMDSSFIGRICLAYELFKLPRIVSF